MNKELKEQAHKEFDEKFSNDILGEVLGTPEELKSFIDSLIDKTVQHEQERIVGIIEEAQKTIRLEQFTVDTIISLITNKSDINK